MAKKSSKNNELLNSSKSKTSPKIYSLLIQLVNDNREDLAEVVLKIDYILEYSSTCIKHKDFFEAKDSLKKAKDRIDLLKKENIDIDYLQYLYDGINKKCK